MKHKSFLLCALALCLLLCGCTTDTDGKKQTTTPQTTPAPTDPFDDIVRREAMDYHSEAFTLKNGAYYLAVSMPTDWEIYSDRRGGYTIERGEQVIGALTYAAVDDGTWQQVEEEENPYVSDFSIEKKLERKLIDNTYAYRFRYDYSYRDGSTPTQVTLTVDYAEADDYTEDELFGNVRLVSFAESANYGMLGGIEDGTVLILGNSFISSSNIGAILERMLEVNNKDMGVRAISRGMAEVSNYIADEQIMQEIRSGYYSAVFICGFYSRTTPEELETLKAACNVSNTKLVVFPAHNENRGTLNSVLGTVKGVQLLDWKAEVEELIDFGVGQWDMCVNDYHKHSTPLAGYVGAHMIYRAVYGEAPKNDPTGVISSSELSKLPTNYRRRGCIIGTLYTLG